MSIVSIQGYLNGQTLRFPHNDPSRQQQLTTSRISNRPKHFGLKEANKSMKPWIAQSSKII
jgi:hypothetical protein